MPAAIKIPISSFELSTTYDKAAIRLMALDRATVLEALFAAFQPWNPELNDIELITTGKLSEQGVKIRIASQEASFFFGAASCKFVKDSANWAEADEISRLIETALNTLSETSGVVFQKRDTVVSLHLQLQTTSSKDILRALMSPELLKLDPSPATAMATVLRWPNRRLTLDGSAALANGTFVQTERQFDATTSFDDMRATIFQDEQDLFKLLDVQEVES